MDTLTLKPQNHKEGPLRLKLLTTSRLRINSIEGGKDGNLRMCVNEADYLSILTHAHAGVGGGHFSRETIAKLIKWSSLWWPTLHVDAKEYVKQCDECQRAKPPITRDDMPL